MIINKIDNLKYLKVKDKEVNDYIIESRNYWVEKGYDLSKGCKVINFSLESFDGNKLTTNQAYAFLREDDTHVHISRFIVEKRGDGFGSQVIHWLQNNYETISAWSKPNNFKFYIKNKFTIQDDSKDEYGYYYCVWSEEDL